MVCPFVRGGVGAVATQALANPYLAPMILQQMAVGVAPPDAIEMALERDPHAERGERQVHVVDAEGRSAAYTGENCTGWAGHECSENLSVAGNMLTGGDVIDEITKRFKSLPAKKLNGDKSGEDLAARMAAALAAGVAVGGDIRGHQSSALIVARAGMPILRLHVECSSDPVGELQTLVERTREIQGYMSGYVEENLVVPLG
jgi:uncharacterized Ntn-hydrolase superfamily protein